MQINEPTEETMDRLIKLVDQYKDQLNGEDSDIYQLGISAILWRESLGIDTWQGILGTPIEPLMILFVTKIRLNFPAKLIAH